MRTQFSGIIIKANQLSLKHLFPLMIMTNNLLTQTDNNCPSPFRRKATGHGIRRLVVFCTRCVVPHPLTVCTLRPLFLVHFYADHLETEQMHADAFFMV